MFRQLLIARFARLPCSPPLKSKNPGNSEKSKNFQKPEIQNLQKKAKIPDFNVPPAFDRSLRSLALFPSPQKSKFLRFFPVFDRSLRSLALFPSPQKSKFLRFFPVFDRSLRSLAFTKRLPPRKHQKFLLCSLVKICITRKTKESGKFENHTDVTLLKQFSLLVRLALPPCISRVPLELRIYMNCIALIDPKNTRVGTANAWIATHLTVITGYVPTKRSRGEEWSSDWTSWL